MSPGFNPLSPDFVSFFWLKVFEKGFGEKLFPKSFSPITFLKNLIQQGCT